MIMKKIAVVFSLMMILTSCTQVKIAYVDLEEVMKEYEGSKKAEEERFCLGFNLKYNLLDEYKDFIEDIEDILISFKRKNEARIPLEQVKEDLRKYGKLDV